jgi:hypothetical protein
MGIVPCKTRSLRGQNFLVIRNWSLPGVILDGDMRELLVAAKKDRNKQWSHSLWVFSRRGERIVDFRWAWDETCKRAGVPDLNFHDLRRTAVRNMRRAGIPQVIRMKISGHKTDSMDGRYNIVDADDLNMARELLQNRRKTASDGLENVTTHVTTPPKTSIPADTSRSVKSAI